MLNYLVALYRYWKLPISELPLMVDISVLVPSLFSQLYEDAVNVSNK